MRQILITIGSVTLAGKAKKILSRGGIKSKLTKTDAQITDKGCSYALQIDESNTYDAVRILRENNITATVHGK